MDTPACDTEASQRTGTHPYTVLVMGVCGCGKTTLARLLSAALGAEFVEADQYHSAANVAKMSAGVALTDADRADWLLELSRKLQENAAHGRSQVLACSALKASYRVTLGRGISRLAVIHLHGSREVLEARLSGRHGHFMPISLLDSQLETLEPPADALVLPLTLPPAQALAAALEWLGRQSD